MPHDHECIMKERIEALEEANKKPQPYPRRHVRSHPKS